MKKKPDSFEEEAPSYNKQETKTPPAVPEYLKHLQEEGADDLIEPRRKWYLFWKKSKQPYIVAKIIFPNRRILSKPVWIKRDGYFLGLGKAFVVTGNAIYTEMFKKKLRPVSYYFWDNPEPIKFVPERTEGLETEKSFKELLETKVVKEMASGQPAWFQTLVVFLLIGIVILLLVVLFKVFTAGGKA